MNESIRFVWAGEGQLSQSLLPLLTQAGHKCVGFFTRQSAAPTLFREMSARRYPSLDFSEAKASVCFLALSDQGLQEVASQIRLAAHMACVHFSASTSLNIFSHLRAHETGVCYPLQSFALRPRSLKDVPFLLESQQTSLLQKMQIIVKSLGGTSYIVSEEQRLGVHIAAVLGNNFGNHLLVYAEKVLGHARLSLDLLKPLLCHTLAQAFESGPLRAQSGPAFREDLSTLEKHQNTLDALFSPHHFLSKMYQAFGQDIMQLHHKKERSEDENT